MISFGKLLKSAREELGWSIDQVTFRSNIPGIIIEKLEQDDFTSFSSPLYAKSFIKKYSDCLDLDLDDQLANLEFVGFETLDSYTACNTVVGSLQKNEISEMKQKFQRTQVQQKNESPIFLAGSVVALICLMATFYYSGSRANLPVAGGRDTVAKFEDAGSSFSRKSSVKSIIVSSKNTLRPLETAGLAPRTQSAIKPAAKPKAEPEKPAVKPTDALSESLLDGF